MSLLTAKQPLKFVVTGGAGFIGSHIAEALRFFLKAEVIVLDNLSSGLKENLANVDKYSFYNVDISDYSALEDLAKQGVFDGVLGIFHVAAQSRIQPGIQNPRETFLSNALGTFNLLELMRNYNIDNIIYSASSSSYGRKNKGELNEDMPTDCLNPYAATKLSGEDLLQAYGKSFGISNVSLKYFNVFGMRSPVNIGEFSPVVGLFYKQALQDKTNLTVVGDGSQKRDFTYVDNVVHANVLAMTMLVEEGKDSKISGEKINIGSGGNYTILDMANRIKDKLKDVRPDLEIEFIPERPGEADETLADNKKAKQLLSWTPFTPLDEALDILTPYYIKYFL